MKSLFSQRLTALAALVFLSAAAPHTASAQNTPQPAGAPHRLSAKTLSQIAALEAEADARTPTEQKVSSQLLFSLKMARGQEIVPGIVGQRTTVSLDGAGFTLVDIEGSITPALRTAIQRIGGRVIGSSVRFGQMRAQVPLSTVEFLASLPEVRFIKPAVEAQLQNPAPVKINFQTSGLSQRKAEVQAHLPGLLAQADRKILGINFTDTASTNAVGSVEDEGDKTHQADTARSTYHIDGTGIKVGVMSDSLDNGNGIYNKALNSGDVSTVTVISGQSGGSGTGEGLAMLEVVHHLAPGAQLYFATGASGAGQFADNIIALQQAGCKVIVDDESYSDEDPFQDATVSQAINTVTASGVMYFSCAANFGNLASGTSSVWENVFNDSGDTSLGDGDIHQFYSGQETDQLQISNSNTQNQAQISLFWSDPLGKSSNDYDLFILNGNSDVVASSTNRQTGTQDPYEEAVAADGDYVVIVKHSGATCYLHVDINSQNSTFVDSATTDRTHGHNAAANAFCVAATPATTAPGNAPAGPYPNPFNSSNVVETFSDDGPRVIYYNPDGSAISGGKSLNKPDFTAADGTSSSLTQSVVGTGKEAFSPFFGTSCAAPHAAAIAALVLSYNNSLTRAQLLSILQNSATDIMASGYDVDSGKGILNAYKALQNTPAPTATPALASLTFNRTSGVGGSAGPTGTVTLTAAATAATTITLSSSSASLQLPSPASVTISAGSTSATFTTYAHSVSSATSVTVTATYNGVSKTATYTINPAVATPALASLTFNRTSGVGGSAGPTGTVTLTAAATAATTITLSSSSASLQLPSPASVTISAGSTSATFTTYAHSVSSATSVTVTATYNGVSKTATYTINPATSGVTPKTLTFNPNPAYSGSITHGTVTLTAAAPTGGTAVTINSVSGSTKTKLITVTVPAGQTTMTFSLQPGYVSATTTFNYSADVNGGSAAASLTVQPTAVQLTGFTITPNPASTSGTLTAAVTLSAAAPTGGAAIKLLLNGTLLGTLSVAAGSTTQSITLFPPQVTTSTVYTYTASYNNGTKTVSVTVNP